MEAALHSRRARACVGFVIAACLSGGTVAQAQPVRDTVRPSKPRVVVLGVARRALYVRWWATDDRGIASFSLFRSGNLVGRMKGTETTISNLQCDRVYRIDVEAVDTSQNYSGKSGVLAKTAPCDVSHAAASTDAPPKGAPAASTPSRGHTGSADDRIRLADEQGRWRIVELERRVGGFWSWKQRRL